MPLNPKGQKIKHAMEKEYGKEKGDRVFFASENKGTIKGVTKKKHSMAKRMKEVKSRIIRGQRNYIVDGHYFNDKKGAHYFAETGKTLKGQHER